MTDVADRVNQAWENVHVDKDAGARVPREDFIKCMLSEVPADEALRDDYEKYLNTLFDASLAMMLPNEKTDLGKHCFGYASVLAQEFYFGADDAAQPKDKLTLNTVEDGYKLAPQDRLATVREEMDKDWGAIEKDGDSRVTKDAFVAYYMGKFSGQTIPESVDSYKAFLEKDFDSATAMMLPKDKSSLGGHCFRYAGLMAGEFYFAVAKAASQPDTPRADGWDKPLDILSIAKSKPQTEEEMLAAAMKKGSGDEDLDDFEEDFEKQKAKEEAETAAKAAEDKPAPAAAAPAAAAGGKYSLEELQNGCPEGVVPSLKEDSLKDDDFQTALKMSRADFEKLPKWKKDAAKKAAKIF